LLVEFLRNRVQKINMPLLEIKDLRTAFDTAQGRIKAIDGVFVESHSGETLGIVGESGCGKPCLPFQSCGSFPPTAESLTVKYYFPAGILLKTSAEEMRALRGSEISMIFQEPMTSLNPVFRVGEQNRRGHSPASTSSCKAAFGAGVEAIE